MNKAELNRLIRTRLDDKINEERRSRAPAETKPLRGLHSSRDFDYYIGDALSAAAIKHTSYGVSAIKAMIKFNEDQLLESDGIHTRALLALNSVLSEIEASLHPGTNVDDAALDSKGVEAEKPGSKKGSKTSVTLPAVPYRYSAVAVKQMQEAWNALNALAAPIPIKQKYKPEPFYKELPVEFLTHHSCADAMQMSNDDLRKILSLMDNHAAGSGIAGEYYAALDNLIAVQANIWKNRLAKEAKAKQQPEGRG